MPGLFSHASKQEQQLPDTVVRSLHQMYKDSLLPLEEASLFSKFVAPPMDEADFTAKPMILLLGQYSTGKTTFIKYLLGTDFPGMQIGPEPTTDKFNVVMSGEKGTIPGNALVVDPAKPFRPLGRYGSAFLNRFQCCQLRNSVLDSVTIVDTPGILSGEKQRISRGYNFTDIVQWFAQVVDCIILLFDAHKLDISDEFRRVIESLREYDNKIRIVLNKADMINTQQLMRVYGALMWNLGKVLGTPEVVRVYIGSFWDQALHFEENRRLFQKEEQDLFQEIQSLPSTSVLRKLDDFLRRIRLVRAHTYLMMHLKKEMPVVMGKRKKQAELLNNLSELPHLLSKQHNIPLSDFPDMVKLKSALEDENFSKFPTIRPKLLEALEDALTHKIPRLMEMVPREQIEKLQDGKGLIQGGVFNGTLDTNGPFAPNADLTIYRGKDSPGWIVDQFRSEWDEYFHQHCNGDKIITAAAKEYMLASKFPNSVLAVIWKLADVDKDGHLDMDEFALANYLIKLRKEGNEVTSLPRYLIPPSKRDS